MSEGTYPPISEHGVIGDLRSAALISTDGCVTWFCARRFDAPSVFGALLDSEKGGRWSLRPSCDVATRQQFYFPDSNILITRFLTEDGIVELQDFLPIRRRDPDHRQRLVRRVVNIRGTIAMTSAVRPRFDYARAEHTTTRDEGAVTFTGPDLTLRLHATAELAVEDGDAVAEFELGPGESAAFVLEVDPDDDAGDPLEQVQELFDATVRYWREWLAQSTYTGRWREMVQRSALTLKLLTHEPTGAIVAAPTCGLPEEIGGDRNWDYRHVWIRDAAFSLYALLRLGFMTEAQDFFAWLSDRFEDPQDGDLGPLRVMYTIDGDPARSEEELDHLDGYRGSRPVRIGNEAGQQLQLDIYGELIDSVYLFNKYGDGISHQSWTNLSAVLEWLLEHWQQPDEGMWETRAGRQNHTISRLMTWVAIERMVRMARQRGLPGDLPRWTAVRDEVYRHIQEDCWDAEAGSYSQHTESYVSDASILLMPLLKFCSPADERYLSTLKRIEQDLVVDSLVFRYDPEQTPDGLDGNEGTFSICSFWYVEALARTGQAERARLALEKMFSYANHVGLYAEEIGLTGDHLGNFPQAFTHLSLISAAINTDRNLG